MGSKSRLKAKRSLGQNFLINENIITKITTIILDNKPEHITEIGPGKGAFTKVFYGTTIPLTLIEKDYKLSQFLQKEYKDAATYNIDFLNFKLTKSNTTYFGSLPFNVANEIIHKIIVSETFKNPAFFIIQKEVAEKYSNKTTNPLGLMREIYANIEILFDIKAGNFKPRPNVTSSFVKFTPHKKYFNTDKKPLEKLIRTSFKTPRKTLQNNLKSSDYKIPVQLKEKRPNQLSIQDYVSILENS
jgi:16S rRNA (adenine1518-N6/adenine1519-N6)-dimethyltransferase